MFYELKYFLSGYSTTPYVLFFNITGLKNCVRLTSYPTETHFPSYWLAHHRSIHFVRVLKVLLWVSAVSCRDWITFH